MERDLSQVKFFAPVQGKMIPLTDVPDQIFAGKLVVSPLFFLFDLHGVYSFFFFPAFTKDNFRYTTPAFFFILCVRERNGESQGDSRRSTATQLS